MIKHLIAAVLATVLISSCEDKLKVCDFSALQQCHRDAALDSAGLANALVGRWRWYYALNCAWATDDPKNSQVFAGMVIELRADGTGLVQMPGSTIQIQWQLSTISPYDGWEIGDPARKWYPAHGSLSGRVRLCGNELLANSSYRDGGDNFFVRD